MSYLQIRNHTENVKGLFTRIATRYDLMNHLMTGWQDVRWRNQVIQLAGLEPGSRLLDIGTGTGDLARSAFRQCPDVKMAAADFTPAMMQVGQKKGYLPFLAADAVALPFPDGIFDAVISGFLMRNVGDRDKALQEQFRVLKKGGRMVVSGYHPPGEEYIFPPGLVSHACCHSLSRVASHRRGGCLPLPPGEYRAVPDRRAAGGEDQSRRVPGDTVPTAHVWYHRNTLGNKIKINKIIGMGLSF